MSLKTFLKVSAILETTAGIGLALVPSRITVVLIGEPLGTSVAVVIGRLAGLALISLGLICWFARNDEQSPATKGIVSMLLFYNVAAAALLAYAGTRLAMSGPGLWPAVLLHTALALWTIALLRKI